MMNLITLFIFAVAFFGLVPFFSRANFEKISKYVLSWSALVLAIGLYIGTIGLLGDTRIIGEWLLDSASSSFVILISIIQFTAVISSISYLKDGNHTSGIDIERVRKYFALVPPFIAAMLATVLADNLGIMWIALEATTLATTMLVAFYQRDDSIEAAWKYILMCSTGLALGLIGTLLIVYASQSSDSTLSFTALTSRDFAFSESAIFIFHLAFVFLFIGFGTKAGIVPMHSWLPDAHSSAPAPISGVLSAIVLPVALFAILRFKNLVDFVSGNSDFTSYLMVIFGAFSVALPLAFIMIQRDYKRLLAYSSVEHMGIALFAFGLGGIGYILGAFHIFVHALIKSSLFFLSGNIVNKFHSTKFEKISGILSTMPKTGPLFLAGVFLLLAVPPSPLFISEMIIVTVGLNSHLIASTVVLVSITFIGVGFFKVLQSFLFDKTDSQTEKWDLTHLSVLINFALVIILCFVAWSFSFEIFAKIGETLRI